MYIGSLCQRLQSLSASGQARLVEMLLAGAGAEPAVLKEIVSDKKDIGRGLSTQSLRFNDLQEVQSDPGRVRHARRGFSGTGPDNERDFRHRVGDKIADVLIGIAGALFCAKPAINSIPAGKPIVGFKDSGEPLRTQLFNPFLITGPLKVQNYLPFAELIGLPAPLNAVEPQSAAEVHLPDAATWIEHLNLLEGMTAPYRYRLPILEEVSVGRNLHRLSNPLDPSTVRKRYAVSKGFASPITYEVVGTITRIYSKNSKWIPTLDESLRTSLVMYWDFSINRDPLDQPTEWARDRRFGLFDIDDGPTGQDGVRNISLSQEKTGTFRLAADWL